MERVLPTWETIEALKDAHPSEYEDQIVRSWEKEFEKHFSYPSQTPSDHFSANYLSDLKVDPEENKKENFVPVQSVVFRSGSVIDNSHQNEQATAEGLKFHIRIPCFSLKLSPSFVSKIDEYIPILQPDFSSIEETLDEMARACSRACRLNLKTYDLLVCIYYARGLFYSTN